MRQRTPRESTANANVSQCSPAPRAHAGRGGRVDLQALDYAQARVLMSRTHAARLCVPRRGATRGLAIGAMVVLGCCTTQLVEAQATPHAQQVPEQSASSASDYDRLIDEALAAFAAEDHGRARKLFERAHAWRPSARTLRGLGITAVELKQYTQAKAELEASLTDVRQALTDAQRAEVTALLAWMQSSLGMVSVNVTPANGSLTVNGERTADRSLVLEPRAYTLRAEADGYEAMETVVRLESGQHQSVDLALVALDLHPTDTDQRQAKADASQITRTAAPSHASSKTVFETWWFWTAVGAVVVGGTVTAFLLAAKPEPKPFEPGGVNGVIMALAVTR
jgi:hypothetical protein